MTEAQRKKRGEKSVVIVERLVRARLGAMGCAYFKLGIRRYAGEMIRGKGRVCGPADEIDMSAFCVLHDVVAYYGTKGNAETRFALLHPVKLQTDPPMGRRRKNRRSSDRELGRLSELSLSIVKSIKNGRA